MKSLVIGESLIEITSKINEPLKEGMKLYQTEKTECAAGHAGNIAYLLGKWGIETYIASMVGVDDGAEKIKKEFELAGIKTDYIETSFDKPTSSKFVLVNATNKNNTIIEFLSNSTLKKYLFAIEPDIIISDCTELNATLQAFEKNKQAIKVIYVNRVDNGVLELCRYANYVIINKESAEKIAGMIMDFANSGTVVNVYNKLKQKYNNADIIITIGELGSVYSINNQVKIMPPAKLEIEDTNGAGDAFTGAFAYATIRKFGLEKAIAYATIAASLCISKLTSREALPSVTEVSNFYDSKFGANNNPMNEVSQETVNNNDPNQPQQVEVNGEVQQVAPKQEDAGEQAPQVAPQETPQSANNQNDNQQNA